MGVDAEMFVRIKGRANWLKPEEELAAAYELASSVGAENFFITRGDEVMSTQHHALSIIPPYVPEDGFQSEDAGKVVWHQDGPSIYAQPDEQFVQIHLYTRYYGPEYARGNWLVIRTVAEWLERRFPTGEVWYGGDSSGICAFRFDATTRRRFHEHYLDSGRKTYTRYVSGRFPALRTTGCKCCEVAMINCGGGRGDDFLYCDGCGKKAVLKADGAVQWLERGVDFFDRDKTKAAN